MEMRRIAQGPYEGVTPVLQAGVDTVAVTSFGIRVGFLGWLPNLTIDLGRWAFCIGWFLD